MSIYIQQYFTDFIFLPGALIGMSVVIHTSKSSGFFIKSYTMKQLLLTLALFIAISATAQVDSFSKEGVVYYTYDARSLPVRNFYPKSTLRRCPYCGEMKTVAHIKEVQQSFAEMDSLNKRRGSFIIFSSGQIIKKSSSTIKYSNK
jgi:hypothetical protein